jgi:hypothetical protein
VRRAVEVHHDLDVAEAGVNVGQHGDEGMPPTRGLPFEIRSSAASVISRLAATGKRIGKCLALPGYHESHGADPGHGGALVRCWCGVCASAEVEGRFRTLTLPDWVILTVSTPVEHAATMTARVVKVTLWGVNWRSVARVL